MDKLACLVFQTSKVRSFDDDFADRLSSRYTVVLLIVFAMLVSMNQYVRNPITCWAPVHFTGAHTRFTTHYCWVKNTYYMPWKEEIPPDDQHKKQVLPYYQWVPIILLLQAVLFFTPSAVWHGLNSKAGVDADNILAAAHTVSRMNKSDCREKTLALCPSRWGGSSSADAAGTRAMPAASIRPCLSNVSATCAAGGTMIYYIVSFYGNL